MEKQEGVAAQMFNRDGYDVPGPREPCLSVSDTTLGLETSRPQPRVHQGEARAAMVILAVVDPDGATVLKDGAVFQHAIRNIREEFRQMESRVGVMADADEEHLSVQIAYTTDRAFRDVGREWERIRGDLAAPRSGCREGMEVLTSSHVGQSPEYIRNHPEAR
jgi:hypothetical protein